jgi:hypothetical protein
MIHESADNSKWLGDRRKLDNFHDKARTSFKGMVISDLQISMAYANTLTDIIRKPCFLSTNHPTHHRTHLSTYLSIHYTHLGNYPHNNQPFILCIQLWQYINYIQINHHSQISFCCPSLVFTAKYFGQLSHLKNKFQLEYKVFNIFCIT